MSAPRAIVSLVLLVLVAVPAGHAAEPSMPLPVSFNRDIRPIMSDTCFHCHGNDAETREAGMRLDIREEALKPTKNGFIPIVPGKPEESEIYLRITDDVEPMPPEDSHKSLTTAQKELIRRWIAEGAVYEAHWAYTALQRPSVPETRNPPAAIRNPIDAFVQAKLAEKKLTPSPEASREQLLRRLSLDLTGLPPTTEERAAFLADASPHAYERQVERLLASPRHGERMAVWWLDVARFADTVGFHGDQNQRIFPYRDYVIGAFNANKRFDQFTVEQLAGDLLPNATVEQRVATGYNRLNMMTREGGAQAKEYLAKYGAERVRSVAAAWFGSTFGCAECHDHKFDPIKAQDFYELQAFFADVKQWGVYSDYKYTPNPDLAGFTNDHPFPPEIEVTSAYLMARKRELETQLGQRRREIAAEARKAKSDAFAAWLADARKQVAAPGGAWHEPDITAELRRKGDADPDLIQVVEGTLRASGPLRRGDQVRVSLPTGPGRVAAVRLQALTGAGNPDAEPSASRNLLRVSAAVHNPAGKERKVSFHFAEATAKESHFLGGAEQIGVLAGWKVPQRPEQLPLTSVWVIEEPLELSADETLVLTLTGEALPDLRFAVSSFAALDPLRVGGEDLIAALTASPDQRSAAQNDLLAETWVLGSAVDRGGVATLRELAARVRETREGRAWSMVTEVAEPITVRVLPRGNWQDESGPIVLPATPSFLPGRMESTPERRLTRLDLARYIVAEENPITARTVMNRLWAMCFGTGLSAAVDDLGSQGEAPSHPELLDWLACEFRDSGWDLRHMLRLIVTSATYRQTSHLAPKVRDADPANRLLAAQSPRRLEAEFVRDNALFVAGALNLRHVGGPSVKPYQPPGYYAALQFPDREYEASTDDEQWRRGLYMHWQRTFLHPMLANFDAPARDECLAQRVVSNTPQQALTLLNDPTFVEAAKLFAARIAREDSADDARLRRAFLLALSREPKPVEVEGLRKLLASQREHYRANRADAEKLLRVGHASSPAGDPAELAAWTHLARVLLNTHEVITRY